MDKQELLSLGCGTYLDAKQLPDGSWAVLCLLITTRALMLGVTMDCPFEHRYCYDDNALCQSEFDKLQSKDDVPSGWIAKRPQ